MTAPHTRVSQHGDSNKSLPLERVRTVTVNHTC